MDPIRYKEVMRMKIKHIHYYMENYTAEELVKIVKSNKQIIDEIIADEFIEEKIWNRHIGKFVKYKRFKDLPKPETVVYG